MAEAPAPTLLHELVGHLEPGVLALLGEDAAATTPAGCLLDVLGIVPTHAGPGACRAEMGVAAHHLNQRGVVQGGAIAALADATAGWATYAALGAQRFTTLEFKTNLLGAARSGNLLVALARPVHLGRTTILLEVDVLNAAEEARPVGVRRLVARFSCTQLVLRDV